MSNIFLKDSCFFYYFFFENLEKYLIDIKKTKEETNDYVLRSDLKDFFKIIIDDPLSSNYKAFSSDIKSKTILKISKELKKNELLKNQAKKQRIFLDIYIKEFFLTVKKSKCHDENETEKSILNKKPINDLFMLYCEDMSFERNKNSKNKIFKIDTNTNSYNDFSTQFYDYLIYSNIFDSIYPLLIYESLVEVTTYCSNCSGNLEQTLLVFMEIIKNDLKKKINCDVLIKASNSQLIVLLAQAFKHSKNIFVNKYSTNEFLKNIYLNKHNSLNNIFTSFENLFSNHKQQLFNFKELNRHGIFLEVQNKRKIFFEFLKKYENLNFKINTETHELMIEKNKISIGIEIVQKLGSMIELKDLFIRLSRFLHARLVNLNTCFSTIKLEICVKNLTSNNFQNNLFSNFSNSNYYSNSWCKIYTEIKYLHKLMSISFDEIDFFKIIAINLKNINIPMEFKTFNRPRLKKYYDCFS